MKIMNRKDLAKWRQERIDKGHSFHSRKGLVNDKERLVVTWIDNETKEDFNVSWYDPDLLERDDSGEPIFLHAHNCPSFCDFACNPNGMEDAELIRRNES